MPLLVLLALLVTTQQPASSTSATHHDSPVPAELASSVAAALAPGGIRAKVGGVTLDFWWVRTLPLNEGPSISWNDVEEGALAGAVRLGEEFRDIRGHVIQPGVYTLRYGIQPDNGDHLGTSPFRDFLLLSPAGVDTSAAPLGHKGTIDISKMAIGGSHPCVWSIDPPVSNDAVLSPHTTELGHQAVTMEVNVSRNGKPAGTLKFGVVLVGRIDA